MASDMQREPSTTGLKTPSVQARAQGKTGSLKKSRLAKVRAALAVSRYLILTAKGSAPATAILWTRSLVRPVVKNGNTWFGCTWGTQAEPPRLSTH